MQRYEASGIFTIEVESKDCREAKEKAQRILHNSGIAGHVVSVEKKKKEDKHE